MRRILDLANNTLFVYYLVSNLIYLGLLVTALTKNTLHRHRLGSLRFERLNNSPFTPSFTIVVPAHNEQNSNVVSIRSLLTLEPPDVQVSATRGF